MGRRADPWCSTDCGKSDRLHILAPFLRSDPGIAFGMRARIPNTGIRWSMRGSAPMDANANF
eukprot:6585287-Pyramimonas_sp.AAC.1